MISASFPAYYRMDAVFFCLAAGEPGQKRRRGKLRALPGKVGVQSTAGQLDDRSSPSAV
jgi:hypothetical protein